MLRNFKLTNGLCELRGSAVNTSAQATQRAATAQLPAKRPVLLGFLQDCVFSAGHFGTFWDIDFFDFRSKTRLETGSVIETSKSTAKVLRSGRHPRTSVRSDGGLNFQRVSPRRFGKPKSKDTVYVRYQGPAVKEEIRWMDFDRRSPRSARRRGSEHPYFESGLSISQVLEETANAQVRTYIIGQRVEGYLTEGGNFQWIVSDGHGSTRGLVDDGGSIVAGSGYDYDAYGNALGFDPAAADTLVLYTNQLFDPVLGQYVLRARYYDPGIGRFSSFDSFEGASDDPMSLHKYAYANVDPVFYVDLSGHMALGDMLSSLGVAARNLAMAGARVAWAWSRAHKLRATVLLGVSALGATVAGIAAYNAWGLPINTAHEPYRTYIKDSAARWRLKPELLAAIIAAEQGHLVDDGVFDDLKLKFRNSATLGLGQVSVATAMKYDLVSSQDRDEVIRLLNDPKSNIDAVAKYLRTVVADTAAIKAAAAGRSGDNFYGVNLSRLALDGSQWDYSNDNLLILIGSIDAACMCSRHIEGWKTPESLMTNAKRVSLRTIGIILLGLAIIGAVAPLIYYDGLASNVGSDTRWVRLCAHIAHIPILLFSLLLLQMTSRTRVSVVERIVVASFFSLYSIFRVCIAISLFVDSSTTWIR